MNTRLRRGEELPRVGQFGWELLGFLVRSGMNDVELRSLGSAGEPGVDDMELSVGRQGLRRLPRLAFDFARATGAQLVRAFTCAHGDVHLVWTWRTSDGRRFEHVIARKEVAPRRAADSVRCIRGSSDGSRTGLMVAILGPDGSGKSSLAERLTQELAPVFSGNRRFHLRPDPFGRRSLKRAPELPHGAEARGLLSSTAKLGTWWVEYLVGSVLEVGPGLSRSQLIIFDRYFDDVLVDPERYRYGGSRNLALLMSRLVPRPDLMFVLDVPTEELIARKQEITRETAARLRLAYRALVGVSARTRIVDAGRALDEVTAEVVQAVLDELEARVGRRLEIVGEGIEASSTRCRRREARP